MIESELLGNLADLRRPQHLRQLPSGNRLILASTDPGTDNIAESRSIERADQTTQAAAVLQNAAERTHDDLGGQTTRCGRRVWRRLLLTRTAQCRA